LICDQRLYDPQGEELGPDHLVPVMRWRFATVNDSADSSNRKTSSIHHAHGQVLAAANPAEAGSRALGRHAGDGNFRALTQLLRQRVYLAARSGCQAAITDCSCRR